MQGKVVGQRYELSRLIGAGGMGSVYEAVDTTTRARVAVKIITAETARNPTLMGRFEREARAATSIDTPHIVKVLDAGVDEPTQLPYLVLEYLEGEDVQQLIKRLGPLPPDLALRIVAQACVGLDRAHEARIIHRDIKPANFYLARTGDGQRVVKLLDFGIAKIIRDPEDDRAASASLTRTGSMLGSPLYMSPEQARGHQDLDRRADLWSLGVVLYQALTGRTPHQDTDALGELIVAICTEEAPPIQELAPWVPPDAAAIAHHAMRFAPEERYQTAAEMLAAILPLLPGTSTIDEPMLRPLADADRGQIAPRLVTPPDAPVSRRSHARTGATPFPEPSPVAPSPAAPALGATAGEGRSPLPTSSLEGFGTTVGQGTSPARAPAAAPSTGARTALVAVAAAFAIGAGGLLAYRLAGTSVPPPPTAALVATPPPALLPAPEPKPRTVMVVVLPGNAAVEIDGASATPADGAVAITGALGSVHKVRLKSGEAEVVRDVVITESGALPPKVELPAPPPPASASVGPARPPPVKGPPRAAATAEPALPLRQQR